MPQLRTRIGGKKVLRSVLYAAEGSTSLQAVPKVDKHGLVTQAISELGSVSRGYV